MQTGLEAQVSSVVDEKSDKPEIHWGTLFPQIFTRAQEIRNPKGVWKNKSNMSEKMKKVEQIKRLYESNTIPDIELRILVNGGAIHILGEALKSFMKMEDNGLLDLIGAGWNVYIV